MERTIPVKTVRAEDALLFRNDLIRARIAHRESKAIYIIRHASQPPAPCEKFILRDEKTGRTSNLAGCYRAR